MQFLYIIPQAITNTPYVLFASFGVHNHPLPPPTTVPTSLKGEIMGLINKMNTKNLTPGKYQDIISLS